MKATIVLPTYNENENIEKIIRALEDEFRKETFFSMEILVVDDYSPDRTSETVKDLQKEFSNLYLIQNNNRGLGNAYVAGFNYCLTELKSNVIFEMDADFSHNPKDIYRFLKEIKEGFDFVIGSRYVSGGSIPNSWGVHRKLNSFWGNIFARYIAGVKNVQDCTSGFRAINTGILKKIDLNNLDANGYFFQLKLLYESIKVGAKVKEIPIAFVDRTLGKSKLGLKDIIEFIINSIKIRFYL